MGGTERASLRATGLYPLLSPRVKANATEEHRNACGTKESTTRVVGKCSLPPLCCPVSCSSSCGGDRAPGGHFTLPCATSTITEKLIFLLLPHQVTAALKSAFRIFHWLWSQSNLVELSSLSGKARQDARAGQGRTFTGQQWDQTSLAFLTNKDHLTAQTNHQLHQHWSPLSITGTPWQLQEKSQSKGLKFTFQRSSSGPGSPPGPC